MAAVLPFDALLDVDETDGGRHSRQTIRRVRAKISKTETGQSIAEHDGDEWKITEAEIVRRFSAPLVLSAELTAELRKHGVARVVVDSVEVNGAELVSDTDTRVHLRTRKGVPTPSVAVGKQLAGAIMDELDPQLDSEPGVEDEPVYGWSFKIN